MTRLETCAVRDAEFDYNSGTRSDAELLTWCELVRCGQCAGPSMDAIAGINRRILCSAWGVDQTWWDISSGQWCRLYDSTYLSTIDGLVTHSQGLS